MAAHPDQNAYPIIFQDLLKIFDEAEGLAAKKQYHDAELRYNDFIQQALSPENSEMLHHKIWEVKVALAFNNRGHNRYMQVKFDLAVEDYTLAIEFYPYLATALYNRGTVHFRMGKFNLALEDFKSAVELRPTQTEFQKALQHTIEQTRTSFDNFVER